ncbi:F0F1 ATP synthase subunit B [Planctomyces sp. SH-PL62]|uniref:F0F1 ATP synthase subunit B n=1 Tax=Planctomyces sp. SH-PL62 TaxID=1636152 RepID=UPI00078E38C9|nr:F0F1 ATP synthase subunit B [Planctomyces sp. SH-PL62]AMV36687.1 ATP synthase subunit b precursor [Planctomyces sp. SH-PL62]
MLRISKSALGSGLVALALAVSVPTAARAFEEAPAAATVAAAHAAPAADGPEAVDAHGEHGGKSDPMEVQPGLAVWTLVVFLGLLFVLGKFAWGPLLQALHRREEHLEHCLLQSEKARNDAEELLAEHRKLMAETDDKVRDLLYKAQRDAQTRAGELLRTAQADADAARDRAQRDIATARDQALSEIWTRTADVAVTVAGRVLARDLGDDDRRRLLDDAIRELPEGAKSGGTPV